MAAISKQEADAWDRVLDAAADLADLIESSRIEIDEFDIEELTIFLARHGPVVRNMLKHLKRTWPFDDTGI
ncbi:YebG family protein [uncultured Desulfosarcina sp.]|uniref:YebG family protein n=1 Tax=uncultured Desulfosarcina sp. TaxID=218289 RepID=UPI0029C70DD8|nr:YebG family protein [uncultured Desulfosarcina sp.]